MTTIEIVFTAIVMIFFIPVIVGLFVLLRAFVIEFGIKDSLCFKSMWTSYKEVIQVCDNNKNITSFGRMIIKGLIAIVLFPFCLLLHASYFVFVVLVLILLPISLLIEAIFMDKKYHFIDSYRRERQKDREWELKMKGE